MPEAVACSRSIFCVAGPSAALAQHAAGFRYHPRKQIEAPAYRDRIIEFTTANEN